MPKMVDADERRKDLAEAVWRVVRRDGLDHASVRNVAQEAGLSTGSLRHYFRAQSDLMIFAMRSVIERIDGRVAALEPVGDPRLAAERVLAELLPLDDERRAENEVWIAFTARAQVDPALRALRDEGYDVLRAACERMVTGLVGPGTAGPAEAGAAPTEEELEVEVDRLFALLDGLAVHAAMRPDRATPERLTAVIARHLDDLAAPRGEPAEQHHPPTAS